MQYSRVSLSPFREMCYNGERTVLKSPLALCNKSRASGPPHNAYNDYANDTEMLHRQRLSKYTSCSSSLGLSCKLWLIIAKAKINNARPSFDVFLRL